MEYAMKQINVTQMNAAERKKAINEIQILASLHNPYIVKFYEAFIESDSLFIVTDYAAQGDLLAQIKRHFKRKTHFPDRTVWSFFIQLCLGIQYLHRHKILHRDLKSANIFVNNQTEIKIGDFGISKVCKPSDMFAKTQIGSPYYVSPEMWKNKPYGQKSDMWAIGCFLYEMVALHPPFQASSLEKLASKIMTGQYDPLPRNTSPDIAAMIRKLLTLDPKARPACSDIIQTAAVQSRLHLLPRVDDMDFDSGLAFTQPDLQRSISTPSKAKDLKGWLPRARYPDYRRAMDSQQVRCQAATEPAAILDPVESARMLHHNNKILHNQTDMDTICEVGADQFELPNPTESSRPSQRGVGRRLQPRFNPRRRPAVNARPAPSIKIGSRHEAGKTPLPPMMRPSARGPLGDRSGRPYADPRDPRIREAGMQQVMGRGVPGRAGVMGDPVPSWRFQPPVSRQPSGGSSGRRHFFPQISDQHNQGHRAVRHSMAGRAVDQMYGRGDQEGAPLGFGDPGARRMPMPPSSMRRGPVPGIDGPIGYDQGGIPGLPTTYASHRGDHRAL
eukprot:TRINITY_DN9331_c0_g1_i12.p1 TRINITY_DN9331_c0_g1~~TRINITY_DN9331_c0_g1_i12.p1  ORF type:complete len:558 (-),score=64.10 TRINITY_DN9331_c0_g1_i12:288-1961(-)